MDAWRKNVLKEKIKTIPLTKAVVVKMALEKMVGPLSEEKKKTKAQWEYMLWMHPITLDAEELADIIDIPHVDIIGNADKILSAALAQSPLEWAESEEKNPFHPCSLTTHQLNVVFPVLEAARFEWLPELMEVRFYEFIMENDIENISTKDLCNFIPFSWGDINYEHDPILSR